MGYGIAVLVLAFVVQKPETAGKADAPPAGAEATTAKLKDARRLLRNGRYAEGEEALGAIESAARKAPGGWTAALETELALERATCQVSQGEYAKARSGLKSAMAAAPKNADLPARLAELELARGDWDAAAVAMRQAE